MKSNQLHTVYGNFPASLNISNLSAICIPKNGVQTGPFGSQLHQKDYVDKGVPIITVEHLGDNKIVHTDTPFVSDDDYNRLIKYNLKKGDIVFSRVGSVDRRALVGEDEDGWLFSGRCLRVRPNNDIIDSGYLSYFFGLTVFKKYVRSIAVGATMPSINTKILSNLPIVYPPLLSQKKIAHILSTLDDKIDLNRKMNDTLEAMAQALFKSWFVDFDPVHLKAKCTSEEELEAGAKELGISKEVLELFPSEFVESEMGMIPLGWEVKPISEVSSVAIGKTPPRKEPQWFTTNTDDIKWVSIRDMGNNGMYTLETSEYLTKEAIERFNVKIIPSNTVLLSFKLTLGRVSITTEAMTSNEAIAHFVLDESSVLSTEFIYCYLKNFDYNMLGSTSSIATAINSKIVKTIPTVVATETTINMFNSMVNPVFKQILGLTKEIQTLENTRDTLLPKLLSGELDVSKLKIAEEN